MNILYASAAAASLLLAASTAPSDAAVITLDFESATAAAIAAEGGDPGLGVTDLLTLNGRTNAQTATVDGNTFLTFDGGPWADFSRGGSSVMNVAAGFDTGLSFLYSTYNTFARQDVPYAGTGEIFVYSGLDGTGLALASFSFGPLHSAFFDPLDPAPGTGRDDPFRSVGLAFTGTARSIVIGRGYTTAFDNLTFGSTNVGLMGGLDRPSFAPDEILSFDVVIPEVGVQPIQIVPTPLPAALPMLLAGLLPIAFLRRRRRM